MTTPALSPAFQRGGTIPTICACCGVLFQARSVLAAYCHANCRRRAGYYRRSGRAVPVSKSWTQPIRPQVVQPEILDEVPTSWQQPEAAALAPFAYDGHQVRVITDDQGEPWFVAADVCAVLGITTEQTRRLDDDEKGLRSMQTPGGTQSMTTVNEFGLYSLILGSRKPEARAFKRWVTHEVLPAIRRTGSYSTPATTHPSTLPAGPLVHKPGVTVFARTRREAAQLWWDAIQGEVHGALARRLNPEQRSDDALPLVVRYDWRQTY